MPLGIAFVQETTVFREYGPLSGSTMRLAYDASPKVSKFLSNQTLDADARYYVRLGANGTFALRARGFKSWGQAPNYTFFGGNSEMRGYDYREFIGHKAFYTNAELRFPLVTAMATPLGVLGGIRGVFYANVGGAGLAGVPFKLFDRNSQTFSVPVTATSSINYKVDGFRLVDARASYGIGLETFALGFPVHFDWSYRTLFNKAWEDLSIPGGSAAFRKPRLTAWIGYDF
jgi:outer membrane protein assembly factor BamA